MSTYSLHLDASQRALLDTEFVRRDNRGLTEARLIKFGTVFLCLLAITLFGVFAVKVYWLLTGFVAQHTTAILTVTVMIHGKKYIYQYCGPKRFVRFVKRQVFAHK